MKAASLFFAMSVVVLSVSLPCAASTDSTSAAGQDSLPARRDSLVAPSAAASKVVPQAIVSDAGVKPNTGKLELIVYGARKKQLIEALTNHFINRSWSIAQSNDYQSVYETDAKGAVGFLSGVFLGSMTQPIYRFTATFVEGPLASKVLCLLELVSNPGSNRPTRTEMMSGKSRQQIRDTLQQLGDNLARELAEHPNAP